MRIAIAGEALIDFTATGDLSFRGHAGGAPANTAVAVARLGQAAGLVSQLSRDLFGERLFTHLQSNGVDMRFVLRSDAPSTLAFVEHGAGTNRYAFYRQGSADALWAPSMLPALPPECRCLHFGSVALLHAPAAGRILDLVAAQRGRRLIVFDPNVRPALIGDAQAYRRDCLQWMTLADLIKLSDEDAAFIAPGMAPQEAAMHWLGLGPQAVVLTCGGDGATLLRTGHAPLSMPAPAVALVDTIGAGDTFGAALSVALLEWGVQQAVQLHALPEMAWREVLRFACTAAALNCTRAGAQPPWRTELDAALAAACGA